MWHRVCSYWHYMHYRERNRWKIGLIYSPTLRVGIWVVIYFRFSTAARERKFGKKILLDQKSKLEMILSSSRQCDQNWQNFKSVKPTTLVIFKSCRANVHLWNRPNIEQKIQPSGRTASKQKLVLLICTVWRIAEKFNLLKLKKFQHKTTPANNQNKNK